MSFQLSISQVCKCKFNKKFGLNSLKHIFFVIHNFFIVCLLLNGSVFFTEILPNKNVQKSSYINHYIFPVQDAACCGIRSVTFRCACGIFGTCMTDHRSAVAPRSV